METTHPFSDKELVHLFYFAKLAMTDQDQFKAYLEVNDTIESYLEQIRSKLASFLEVVHPQKRKLVLLQLEGGALQAAWTSVPIEILLFDFDNDEHASDLNQDANDLKEKRLRHLIEAGELKEVVIRELEAGDGV